MRFTLLLLAVSCLPQVGPPVPDGSVIEDGGTGGGAGGASAGGGAGGGTAGCPAFAGCTTFTDATTVTFPNGNDNYSPKCLRVRAGQPVSFNGNRSDHPLAFACGPGALPAPGSQVTFTTPGVYGYYCDTHGTIAGGGMAGAIEVLP